MALNPGQRTAYQAIENQIVGDLLAKYGPSAKTEFTLARRDNTGQVIGLVVGFNFLGATDPDGVQPLIRKEVDVW